jgi:hypothetical protein
LGLNRLTVTVQFLLKNWVNQGSGVGVGSEIEASICFRNRGFISGMVLPLLKREIFFRQVVILGITYFCPIDAYDDQRLHDDIK